MNNKDSILITGCAGFIGSHTVDYFLSKGFNVIGVDCLTYAGNLENLDKAFKKDNFKFIRDDICNTDNIISICKNNDVTWIVNFAAETHVDNSIKSCERFIHSNVSGVHSLLEACRRLNLKIFHISTDEVYGSILDGSFREDSKLNPANPYSATKAAGEHLITSYNNTHNVDFLIVRPSNNFGPRQNKEKFIPTILRSIKNTKKIPIYGSGNQVRDWLFVKDTARAIYFILKNSKLNEIYNITTLDERENIETVRVILNELGLNPKNYIEFIKDRPGHDFRYSVDNSKIKNLGFNISTDFVKYIQETITSYGVEI